MHSCHALYMLVRLSLVVGCLLAATPIMAQDAMLEHVLRTQAFNQLFEGFDYYSVTIERDQPQADGSREVTAVASGKFLDHVQRMKVLFLIAEDQVIGGQVLEETGLPPCQAPEQARSSL